MANEIVAWPFPSTWIPLSTRQPVPSPVPPAHAAVSNLARFNPSAHLLNVSVHTVGQGWSGVVAGRYAPGARKPAVQPIRGTGAPSPRQQRTQVLDELSCAMQSMRSVSKTSQLVYVR